MSSCSPSCGYLEYWPSLGISCNNPDNTQEISCLVKRDDICTTAVTCSNATPCDLRCASHYKCQNIDKCVLRATICDGNSCNGCPEDHDWKNGIGFKCLRDGMECILPQQLLSDNVWDCDGGIDRCFEIDSSQNSSSSMITSRKLDTNRCFQCLNDAMIIPATSVCDKIIDCSDLSDECLCEEANPLICDQVIKFGQKEPKIEQVSTLDPNEFPSASVTLSGPDEVTELFAYTHTSTLNSSEMVTCAVGYVLCSDGICVSRNSICDGIKDCKEDETYDICAGTLSCKDAVKFEKSCRCQSSFCETTYGRACNGVADCKLKIPEGSVLIGNDSFPEDECEAFCYSENSNFTCIHSPLSLIPASIGVYQCVEPQGVTH